MNAETIIRAIKERQKSMQEVVFNGDEAAFAAAKGRWLGLGEAVAVISEELKKERNNDED